jgi:hypothetical protein
MQDLKTKSFSWYKSLNKRNQLLLIACGVIFFLIVLSKLGDNNTHQPYIPQQGGGNIPSGQYTGGTTPYQQGGQTGGDIQPQPSQQQLPAIQGVDQLPSNLPAF